MDAALRVPAGSRVFVEDARRNGSFLRVTWHPEPRQFVVSNWEGNVCVGATQVPVDRSPELIALLADGLVDAARHPEAVGPAVPQTLGGHLTSWWRARGRRRLAAVVPLRRP
jgi:hypothetical protein